MRSMTRPRDDENRALKGAYRKGREAYADGQPIERCPYPDWTTARGSVTFSRAFRRYWFEDYEELRARFEELRAACEAVVATAHGNRYGLTTEDVLAAQLLAAGEVERALGPDAVAAILAKHGGGYEQK